MNSLHDVRRACQTTSRTRCTTVKSFGLQLLVRFALTQQTRIGSTHSLKKADKRVHAVRGQLCLVSSLSTFRSGGKGQANMSPKIWIGHHRANMPQKLSKDGNIKFHSPISQKHVLMRHDKYDRIPQLCSRSIARNLPQLGKGQTDHVETWLPSTGRGKKAKFSVSSREEGSLPPTQITTGPAAKQLPLVVIIASPNWLRDVARPAFYRRTSYTISDGLRPRGISGSHPEAMRVFAAFKTWRARFDGRSEVAKGKNERLSPPSKETETQGQYRPLEKPSRKRHPLHPL